MCGIVGTLNLASGPPADELNLRQMLGMIRHRGPDQFGIFLGGMAGLGNARLSIIDPSHGQQPISNEDGTLWITFNGEIFNHTELRLELQARGHHFTTNCDTETIVHAYEEYGPECLSQFNGQFVFAIWNTRDRSMFIARDRLGVRPLFYTLTGNTLIFSSEIKAMLADPRVSAEFDPLSLDQIFTYWSTLSPRTAFRNIVELPPGHFMLVRDGQIKVEPYWELTYPEAGGAPPRRKQDCVDEFRSLLIDATKLRLRSDVPVGAYLSGGLDSSTIAAIIRNYTNNRLDTFSISFSDPEFDESGYQSQMAAFLGTNHHVVYASHADIGRVFPDVIWHAETPIMRASPAPMFLLSKLVQDQGFKVVLTGEGADEILAGYDIFKEAKVRRFWAQRPDSNLRPWLFKKIYPWISGLSDGSASYLAAFFGLGLTETNAKGYSHAIRWRTTTRTKRFFSEDLKQAIERSGNHELRYPEGYVNWDPLHQAEYIEVSVFLSQYLLSSQSDRMAMAHSVEGRFPFLDHRVVEFCNNLPPRLKLLGLTEKYLLKEVSREWLPGEICSRPKQPFRAPIHRSFFPEKRLDYVQELLSPAAIASVGLFNPSTVNHLTTKLDRGLPLGETDDMALAGLLSTQLVATQFISGFQKAPPIHATDDVKVVVDHLS
jgi:asparagine synthase (glutamine-hydrolysing)